MKVFKEFAAVFVLILATALFAAAQAPVTSAPVAQPVPVPQATPVVANQVQLVLEGTVLRVHDGDTITLVDQDGKKSNIRLQGIDAPELKQERGSDSQQNLSRMVLGKKVQIFWSKVDKYRRTVGTIMLDGRDVNVEQVRAGLAWHYKKYEDEQSPQDRVIYAQAELQARAAKLGLWKDGEPTPPGTWRQEVKVKRWGPPPPEGTIVGNKNSKKYHRPDCAGYRDMAERNRVFFKTVEEAEAAGFKRAGNCPAEIQTVAKPVTPVPSAPVASTEVATGTTTALPAETDSEPPTDDAVAATEEESPVQSAKPTPSVNQTNVVLAPPTGNPLPIGQSQLIVIGNKNSKVYHLPGCSSYNKVSEKNQVRFTSVEEAEKAGFRRAGNCPVPK